MSGKIFWRRLPTAVFVLVPLLPLLGQNPTQRPDDKGPAAVQAKELNLAGDKETKVQGKLAAEDPKDKFQKKSPCHYYAVKLLADVHYKIDLMSDDFDAFLRLEDSMGKILAEDDDGGEGVNSRIIFKAPAAGTFRIIATSVGGKNGAYVMTVNKATAQEVQNNEQLAEAKKLTQAAGQLHRQRKYAEALPLAKKALEIRKKIQGEQHPETALLLNSVGLLLHEQRDYVAARPYFEQALAINKKALGEQHAQTTYTLNNLGSLLQDQGDYAAARPYYEQALAIRKKVLGEHTDTATSFNNLGVLLQQQGDLAGARTHFEQALAMYKKVVGEEHRYTASSLNSLGVLLVAQGDYAAARPYYEQALAIRKKILGEQHPLTGNVLNNLGLVHLAQGDYAAALTCFEQALAIRKKALGEQHPDTAWSLSCVGSVLRAQAEYEAARPYFEQALAINRKVLGEQHSETALVLSKLGSLMYDLGDFAAARPLYEKSLAILKKTRGEQHPSTATALNDLGMLLADQGEYAVARTHHEQALSIYRKVLGEQHPFTANSLGHLGWLLRSQGDYAAAQPYFEQALAVNMKVLGKEHPSTATDLNNLGLVLQDQKDYAGARTHYEQALAIRKKVLGEQHPLTAVSLNNLGWLAQNQGDYAGARTYHEKVLAIRKKTQGEQHPATALSLNSLGLASQGQGDFAAAQSYFEQALAIRKKVLGERHPDTARSLDCLGLVLQDQKDFAEARRSYALALGVALENLDLAAAGQSERQQFAMANKLRHQLDNFLTLARDAKLPADEAYAPVLAWKGAVFLRQRQMRLVRDQPELAGLAKDLQAVSTKLARLAFAVPDPKKREAWQRQLADLTQEREKLERELSKRSREFRQGQDLAKLTLAELRKSLPADVALVDFLVYQHRTPPAKKGDMEKKEARLTVFVIRADAAPVQLDLGPAAPIAEAVDQWLTNLIQRRRVPAEKDPAKLLREKVWLPLEEHIKGAKTILIAPDGALSRAPLSALPGKDPEKYLIEDLALVVLPVPRLLPVLLAPQEKDVGPEKRLASMLLVGAVDYDAAPGKARALPAGAPGAGQAPRQDRTGALLQWSPLEGTRGEILAIRDSFEKQFDEKGMTILRGDKATKSAVEQLAPKHRFLHLATHGFFAPKALKSALAPVAGAKVDLLEMPGETFASGVLRTGVTGYNPGLLSGVVLAGANRKAEPNEDDGILTAPGVMDLDLRGVDLAVLSACETGLGETAGGEGLLGLQRAFQVAGARSTVASLWKVDDRWTRELMERFYEYRWSKNMSTQEALRQAQLWVMREGPKRGLDFDNDKKEQPPRSAPPFYWAAFVLSGDWR